MFHSFKKETHTILPHPNPLEMTDHFGRGNHQHEDPSCGKSEPDIEFTLKAVMQTKSRKHEASDNALNGKVQEEEERLVDDVNQKNSSILKKQQTVQSYFRAKKQGSSLSNNNRHR